MEAIIANNAKQYNDQMADNIRCGIFGAVGYLAGGDDGSFIGVSLDGVAMSVSSPGTARGAVEKPIEAKAKQTTTEFTSPRKTLNAQTQTFGLYIRGASKPSLAELDTIGVSNEFIGNFKSAEKLLLNNPNTGKHQNTPQCKHFDL